MYEKTFRQHENNFLNYYVKYGHMQIIFCLIFSHTRIKFRNNPLNLWIIKVTNKLQIKSAYLSSAQLREGLFPIYFFPCSFVRILWILSKTLLHVPMPNFENHLSFKDQKKLKDSLYLRIPNDIKDRITWHLDYYNVCWFNYTSLHSICFLPVTWRITRDFVVIHT